MALDTVKRLFKRKQTKQVRAPMMEVIKSTKTFGDWITNPDEVLLYESAGTNYTLYYKMLRTNLHLYSVYAKRHHNVSSLPWEVQPFDAKNASAIEQAEFIARAIDGIPDWPQVVGGIVGAAYFGFTVQEPMYDVMDDGTIGIVQIKGRHNNRFTFDNDHKLNYKPDEYSAEAKPMPDRKYILSRYQVSGDSPYGHALAQGCYWMDFIQRECLKDWAIYGEKFGMPILEAITKDPSLKSAELDVIEAQLDSLTTASCFRHSEGVALNLLEAARRGDVPYSSLINKCEDHISRALVGSTLTMSEGQRHGSQALGRVHRAGEQDIVEYDAKKLIELVNDTIVRWLVDFNYPPASVQAIGGYPLFTIKFEASKDLTALSDVIDKLVKVGFPVPLSYVRETFTIPEPEEGEEILSPPAVPVAPTPTGKVEDEGKPEKDKDKEDEEQQAGARGPVAQFQTGVDRATGTATPGKKPTPIKPPEGIETMQIGSIAHVQDRFRSKLKPIYDSVTAKIIHEFSTNPEIIGNLDDFLNDLVLREFKGNISGPLRGANRQALREAGRQIAERLKAKFNNQLFNQLARDYLKVHAYDKGILDGIADTMREVLSSKFDDLLAETTSIDEIVSQLETFLPDLARNKIEQIAITETRNAANWTVLEMGKRSGMALEAWFLVDPASCEICHSIASKNPYPIEEAQNNPTAHPNCNDQWVLTPKKARK